MALKFLALLLVVPSACGLLDLLSQLAFSCFHVGFVMKCALYDRPMCAMEHG